MLEDLQFDFIIIDEAHHAVANSYQKLWEYCPDSKKLGVTATPWRMNNSGFAKIFDAYIPSMPIKDFISKGWLATYQYYSIPTNSEIIKSIESIREFDVDGDYKHSALVEVFDTTKIRAQLYNSYAKNAFGKKGAGSPYRGKINRLVFTDRFNYLRTSSAFPDHSFQTELQKAGRIFIHP